MPLDRHAQRFLKMLALSGPPALGDAAQRRRQMEALCDLGEVPAEPGVGACELTVGGADGPLAARLYSSEQSQAPSPALVYIHGGGWVAGSLRTHEGVCRRLAAAAGCKVLAVDYRLAPDHRFPAGLEDTVAAFRWVRDNAEDMGLDPARLGLAGDSAGANLAAAAATVLSAADETRPAVLLLICPILDVARRSPSRDSYAAGFFLDRTTTDAELADYAPPGHEPSDPRLSPLLAEDISALPPTLVHTAEFDPCHDEAVAFVTRLEDAGVSVRHTDHPGMIHYFYALPRPIPYALEAAKAIGADVRACLGE